MRGRFPALVAVAVGMAVLLVGYPLATPQRLQSTDFVNFYAAATIVMRGRGRHLYSAAVQAPLLRSISGLPLTEYFLHPPFEAAAFSPLALLPFPHAYTLWLAINAALMAMACWVFATSIPLVDRHPWMGFACFFWLPALVALVLGQDSICLLLILAGAYALLRRNRPLSAGLLLSLAAIKFQYLSILALLFLLARRWRLLLGLLIGVSALIALSAAVVGPHGLVEYARFLERFSAHGGYGSLHPDLMVSWRGFLAGLGWTSAWIFIAGEAILLTTGAACALACRDDAMQFSAFLLVAVTASPYAHFADTAVLVLPALLLLDRAMRSSGLLSASALAAGALFVLPPLLLVAGGHYWWNSRIWLFFAAATAALAVLTTEALSRNSRLVPSK